MIHPLALFVFLDGAQKFSFAELICFYIASFLTLL